MPCCAVPTDQHFLLPCFESVAQCWLPAGLVTTQDGQMSGCDVYELFVHLEVTDQLPPLLNTTLRSGDGGVVQDACKVLFMLSQELEEE